MMSCFCINKIQVHVPQQQAKLRNLLIDQYMSISVTAYSSLF